MTNASDTQTQQLFTDSTTSLNANDAPDTLLEDVDNIPDFNQPSFIHTKVQLQAVVDDNLAGLRFDQIAASLFDQYSRERLKQWMLEGSLTVNGKAIKPKNRAVGGELLQVDAELQVESAFLPQNIPLDIIYQDTDIIVINKPVGLVVHPGAGHSSGTLVNGLLYFDPSLAELPRAGLVHRIDKDTSGLLVIARNLPAQHHLSAQLENKSVFRVYDAIVQGNVIAGGTVDEPIRRHSVDRTRMSVAPGGRPSVTHYKVVERFAGHTQLRVQLETGRTHQIRVHMAHILFPLVGDSVYGGGRLRIPKGATPELIKVLQTFKRQALHARKLGLVHPTTGENLLFEADWPEDFSQLVEALQADAQVVVQY